MQASPDNDSRYLWPRNGIRDSSPDVDKSIENLYLVFSRYDRPGTDFCSFCYDETEVAYFRTTHLRDIETDKARKLLWEAADHWESSGAYRYYLPRILEVMAFPTLCDDLYPEHVFEVLTAQGFHGWPADEREAVLVFIAAMRPVVLARSPDDAVKLDASANRLRGGAILLS